jgi:hypothetical protein
LLNVVVTFAVLSLSANGAPDAPAVSLDALLDEYNAGLARAASEIDSLRVEQIIIDPQEDGSTKEARAVLTYARGGGMEREIVEAGVPYLMGNYTLISLLGPRIDTAEYDVEYEGVDEKEGVECYRLGLTATVRDADHFDGTVWVSKETPGPVRIIGKVADAPFPAVRVELDKAFERGPCGFWLVRRHSGEVEVSLLVRRTGVRHIFYENYQVVADARGPCGEGGAEAGGGQ